MVSDHNYSLEFAMRRHCHGKECFDFQNLCRFFKNDIVILKLEIIECLIYINKKKIELRFS